jgi:hypothetical protein
LVRFSRVVLRLATALIGVSLSYTVTVCSSSTTVRSLRACTTPTWILWPAIWMLPLLDTTRSTPGVSAGGGTVEEGRASRMRAHAVDGSGQRGVRRGWPPSSMTCRRMPSRRTRTRCPRRADADLPAADADPAAAVDHPVRLHRRHILGDGGQW